MTFYKFKHKNFQLFFKIFKKRLDYFTFLCVINSGKELHMPLYEYKCTICSNIVELNHSVSALGHVPINCPKCADKGKTRQMEPKISASPLINREILENWKN